MKKTLKFEVKLDENHLPLSIEMCSDDSSPEKNIKALILSAWSAKSKETKMGSWVIFDFGGLSQDCFDKVSKNSKGKKTSIKGILKKYCAKVRMLK